MAAAEAASRIVNGLKQAGIDFVVAVPDINMLDILRLLEQDPALEYTPVGREEEGIGLCTGGYLTGHRTAIFMQNGGLMNSCNGLTTTALQFGIPILLMVYYAGHLGDNAFHMLGLVTEPVLRGLDIKYQIMTDPAKVQEQIAQGITLAEAAKRPVALLMTRAVL